MPEEYPVVFMQDGIEARITDPQRKALKILAQNWRGVQVFYGAYGLPDGYISITLDPNRYPIYGGISPEGEVST